MSVGRLGRSFRHVQRYREIATILVRYGFGDLVRRMALDERLGVRLVTGGRLKLQALSRPERVRMMLGELGPTFVKLGQILSMRPDLVPPEYAVELAKLQDEVPPFSFADARRIVEAELGRPLDEIFPRFDERPLASASLGQVHRARDVTGRDVVVKVQRPGIERRIRADLDIMRDLAGLLERRVEGWDVQHPTGLVEELGRSVDRELDYTVEASHMERFAGQFAGDPRIHVPAVHRELTTPRVLTMELIDGTKPTDRGAVLAAGLDPALIAARGADLILEQILVHGFFHADPHAGNLRLLPGHVVCYLDYGMMGRLDRRSREHFADLILAVAERDETAAADGLLHLMRAEGDPDRVALERDVAELMDRHFYRPLKEMRVGRFFQDLIAVVSRHHLQVPPDLFLMLKALGTVEGIGRELDEDFDILRHAEPFIRELVVARWRPDRVVRDLGSSGVELFGLLRTLPREIRSLTAKARRGELRLLLEHRSLEAVLIGLERVGNRLAVALVLAGVIVGAAIVTAARIPPLVFGLPLIGLAGLALAAVMGLVLAVAILRHGRM